MNIDEMINRIVEEVVRRLEQRMKKALVVFTGGTIGFQESVWSLKQLQAGGWDFKVFLSRSAEFVLTPQLVQDQLGVKEIYLESEIKDAHFLQEGISRMLIPVLTLNTAVKAAIGISDTIATQMISHAILQGIPIVAAKDACDLKNPARLKLGMDKAPLAYLARMEQYLSDLEDYGIRLVGAKDLHLAIGQKSQSSPSPMKEKGQVNKEVHLFQKRVLSRADIMEAKEAGSVLQVSDTTILTSLALDAAKEWGVQIIRQ